MVEKAICFCGHGIIKSRLGFWGHPRLCGLSDYCSKCDCRNPQLKKIVFEPVGRAFMFGLFVGALMTQMTIGSPFVVQQPLTQLIVYFGTVGIVLTGLPLYVKFSGRELVIIPQGFFGGLKL